MLDQTAQMSAFFNVQRLSERDVDVSMPDACSAHVATSSLRKPNTDPLCMIRLSKFLTVDDVFDESTPAGSSCLNF
jgi:hypothetical protein